MASANHYFRPIQSPADTHVYRPDSPCWDGKYDHGVYICHVCECCHPDGICCGPLMAPTPTYAKRVTHCQDASSKRARTQ